MARMGRLLCLVLLTAAVVLGAASRLEAQRPGPLPPPQPGNDPAAPPVLDVSGVRTFATWIDDAEVLEPGASVLSFAVTRWHWALGHGTGLPTLYGAIGVAPRLQIGASVERDASRYADGTRQTLFGDSYIVGKAVLVDAQTHRVGIAVSPLLQILSASSLDYYRYYKSATTGRIQWALPVHLQVALGSMRVSASAGYFSVGTSFAGASLDAPVGSRLVVVGTISQSYSTDSGTLADELDVGRQRTDASGGAWIVVSPSVYVFGLIGRTISATDLNSMTLSANAGIAVFLRRRSSQP